MRFHIPASKRRPFRVLAKSAHLQLSSLVFQTGPQQRAAINDALRTMRRGFHDMDHAAVYRTIVEYTTRIGTTVSIDLISANSQLHALNEDTLAFSHGYEPEVAAIVDQFVPDNGTMLDIGANFGYFSLFLLSRPSFTGAIHAFEPSLHSFADLLTLLAHVDHFGQVRPYRLALGNQTAMLALLESQSDGLSTIMPSMANRVEPVLRTTEVPVRRLDDFSINSVDLIKIDVEGAEYQVLVGANQLLRSSRPAVVFESWTSIDDSLVFTLLAQLQYAFFIPGWPTVNGPITTTASKAADLVQLILL